MKQQNKFYERNESPDSELSKKMWNEIEKNIISNRKEFNFTIERKSFTIGFSAAAIFVLIIFNLYAFLSNIAFNNEPEIMKINRTYSKTISRMEILLPASLFDENQSINLDEQLVANLENLNGVNQAINELYSDFSSQDLSLIKQERLRNLYKMKLDVLESLILMEETQK